MQCRTVEVFESFGLAEEVLREGYHVLETVFWGEGEGEGEGKRGGKEDEGKGGKEDKGKEGAGIVRTGRTADTAPGLSHLPHIILNQARINGLLLGDMRRCNRQAVDYGYTVKSVRVEDGEVGDPEAHCVTVVAEKDGRDETFAAKYVLVSFLTPALFSKKKKKKRKKKEKTGKTKAWFLFPLTVTFSL